MLRLVFVGPVVLMLALSAGCGGDDGEDDIPPDLEPDTPDVGDWWKPRAGETWQWQLTGALDATPVVGAYDLDLFTTPAADVAALRARGVKTICYVSVGSWEPNRPDSNQFPAELIGRAYEGWPDERWLDIRQIDRLAPIMGARLDLCRDKGFDGIEPDNIDGYTNATGFAIRPIDQIRYNRWLAHEAHRRGLSIGLKNDPAQAAALDANLDWALVENCFAQGDWCAEVSMFVRAGKPVFMAEYTEQKVDWPRACARARDLKFSALLKHRDLDAWFQTCP
jgi:endo-alpha-1,4-polygalactosaminidase (GH114 family)